MEHGERERLVNDEATLGCSAAFCRCTNGQTTCIRAELSSGNGGTRSGICNPPAYPYRQVLP